MTAMTVTQGYAEKTSLIQSHSPVGQNPENILLVAGQKDRRIK